MNTLDTYRDLRSLLGLTYADVAVRMGCTRQYVQFIESNKRSCESATARYCDAIESITRDRGIGVVSERVARVASLVDRAA